MTEDTTDPAISPETVYGKLPDWYRILVDVGSAIVGGFFGAIYGLTGIIAGSVGGMAVAIFWLSRVSKFKTQSIAARIFGGIGWGVVAGLIDTAWLHATGQAVQVLREIRGPGAIGNLEVVLVVAAMFGLVAGAVYGLLCMIVLEVQRAVRRRTQA